MSRWWKVARLTTEWHEANAHQPKEESSVGRTKYATYFVEAMHGDEDSVEARSRLKPPRSEADQLQQDSRPRRCLSGREKVRKNSTETWR